MREPLLHFVLLGAAIFVLYGLVSDKDAGAERRVVVDQGTIDNLAETFQLTWQRPPTPEELQNLVEDRVREEILAREAVNLGLAEDDIIVRRRLRQKMELLAESASKVQPTDRQLEAWYEIHAADYRAPARLSLRQVYLSRDKHGDALAADAEAMLGELRSGQVPDPASAGDPTLLAFAVNDAPITEIARIFGQSFADAVGAIPTGEWSGPVQSGFGLHLVFIDGRTEGRSPTLEEVRPAVLRDWRNDQARLAREAFYQAARAAYQVEIAGPR